MHDHKTPISHGCRQTLLKFSREKVTEKKRQINRKRDEERKC